MDALAAMPQYEAYKESGVDWLGSIPCDWDIRRIKFVFSETNERSKNGSEELLSVSQYTGITRKSDKLAENDLLTNAETLEGYKKVTQGELVSNIMLAWNGSLGFSPFDGIVSPAYSVYRLLGDNNQRYFHYLLRTEIYKAEYKRRSSGVIESRLRLYTEDFFDIRSLLPPIEEQVAIAKFLDHKTAQVDEAIAIKEKQIALLKERKQIIIQNAVTRGLNPDVPMKDSGVDWIGQIPEHWNVVKLKTLISNLESGVSVNASESESAFGDEVGVLKTSAVYAYKFDSRENKKVFDTELKRVSCPVKAESIIISRMNAPELVGASGYVECDYPNLFLPDRLWQARFSSVSDLVPKYVSKVLIAKGFRGVVESIATGSSPSMKNISKGDLLNAFIGLPPEEEIGAIINYLEKMDSTIDDSINLQNTQIQNLKEYKTILINSAVTGKIKVA